MSYSMEDFFDDHIGPHLSKGMDSDVFLSTIKSAMRSDRSDKFAYELLYALVNPDDERMSDEDLLKKCFEITALYNEKILRKLEYSKGNAVVSVNFEGVPDER